MYGSLVYGGDGATRPTAPQSPDCTVWMFLDPECPICQSYTLTLRKLHADYADKGVSFRAVYASGYIKRKAIRRFHKTYQLPFPAERDPDLSLARRWQATVTPEVVVTSPLGEVLYQGAIDDWYFSLGKNRTEPTAHYLRDALESIQKGEPVARKRTEAVGCLLNI